MFVKRGGKAKVAAVSWEIFLLVMSTVAIAFIVGQADVVRAEGNFVYFNEGSWFVGDKLPAGYSGNYYQAPDFNSAVEASKGLGRGTMQFDSSGHLQSITDPASLGGSASTSSGTPLPTGTNSLGSVALAGSGAGGFNSGSAQVAFENAFGKGEASTKFAESMSQITSKAEADAGFAKFSEQVRANPAYSEADKTKIIDAGRQALQAGATQASTYSYDVPFIGYKITNFFAGNLVEGLVWSIAVVGAIQLVGRLVTKDTQLVNSLSAAAFAGIMAGKAAYGLFGVASKGVVGSGGILAQSLTPLQAGLIGVGVAAVVFILLYKKEKKKVVELECLPWEAPLGGASCEKCNQDPIKPCSEYRCKSLGQACELVNKGSNEERCVWATKGDVNSPIITPWTDVLTKNHRYSPLVSRPTALGTTIQSSETASKCIKPFTPLQFGITTNEPSQCKIGLDYNQSFNDMPYYFGESNLFAYNHTEKLRLPSVDSINAESPEVPTEGKYNFYVVCQDVNGNKNEDKYLINFCVDKSPDTTPPIIEGTSITSGSPVTFGTQNVPLTVYLNEPAECRWSIQDKTYNLMENNMSCSTHVYEQNAQQQYPCNATLNGIKDRESNLFYFRCKDQPYKNESDRNTNQESYTFRLRGSQPLTITEVGPNSTFRGGTDIVAVNLTVKTNAGSDEGRAICSFSPSGNEGSFIPMFVTDSFAHSQTLTLPGGSYNYQFRCVDAGGNAAVANTSFNVLVDRLAPRVTRVYKDLDVIKLTTDEAAACTYSLTSCTYDMNDGIPVVILNTQNRMIHGVPWQSQQTYYIKCKDDYGNQPGPSSCSVIASASTFG